jgi:hypothetical protein
MVGYNFQIDGLLEKERITGEFYRGKTGVRE